MHYLAVVVLFPLLFWALSLGCGLLVEQITGASLPALLLMPLGFAVLVVVSQFTTWWGPTAPLTPLVLLALALLGFALGRKPLRARCRERAGGWWWGFAAAVAVYAIVAAPEIVVGRVTFSGYLLDTTGAIQIAGAERLLHHAHNFSTGLPAYGTTLAAYFGNGYPSGGHSVLASVGWLSGQDLIWIYSPFQALELSLAALVFAFLAGRAGLGRIAAALAGTVASVPALVYAYALMGSIKEMTALPMLVLMGALAASARELAVRAGIRAIIPFAIAAAAALGAIGIAASPWVALLGALAVVVAVPITRATRRRDGGRFLLAGTSLAALTALVALPTVGPLSTTLQLAENVSSSDTAAVSDPGNLLRPLKFLQTFGVWLGESHRVEPRYVNQTYLALGVVFVCVALGVAWLVRRRAWSVIGVVAAMFVVFEFLHGHATTWTNAKLLMLLSPVAVFVALLGGLGLMRRRATEGLVLTLAVIAAVLASDALLYHGTNLAPTARFTELNTIDARFAHQGPTLAPDFEEYDLYLLRKLDIDVPGLAYSGPFDFVGGAVRAYGHSYDLDSLALPSVERFRTIVMRRSPAWSRPPGNFKLIWSGRYYSAWRRVGPAPLLHVPLGTGFVPSALPSCRTIAALASQARSAGVPISFARRQLNVSLDLARAARTPAIVPSTDLEGRPQFSFAGPARMEMSFRVTAAGRYELWLGGDVDRPLEVQLDGRRIGAPSAQSGDDGTVIDVGSVSVGAGKHLVRLVRHGGDLRPGDTGSTVIDGIVLEPGGGAEAETVQSVPASAWRSLCGQPLDWIELG